MATLQNNIQKALSAGYTNEQIWERLQNDKRIKEAKSKGYTSGQIRKRLGLDIPQVGVQPGIQPGIPKPMQPAGAPALSIRKPTVFDRTLQEAQKFEQPKASTGMQMAPPPVFRSLIQNPPITAELRAAPEQAESIKGFWDAQGKFIPTAQRAFQQSPFEAGMEKAKGLREQAERLRRAPNVGDYRIQAFLDKASFKSPKNQRIQGLREAFPYSSMAGSFIGGVTKIMATSHALGGIKAVVNASPWANLLSWQFRDSTQALRMMAKAAQMSASFGSAELAQNAFEVIASGEKPTVETLVKEPLRQAGWGVLSGTTYGIKDIPTMLGATAGASVAYDTLTKYIKNGQLTKDDVSDIVLAAAVRTAVRSLGRPELVRKWNVLEMEKHFTNKLWANLMRGKPSTPEAEMEVQKSLALLILPGELRARAPLPLFGKGIRERDPGILINQVMNDLERPAHAMVVEQKFPGFEGFPTEMKERIISQVIGHMKKGTPIDQAIDRAAEVTRPFTEKVLETLSSLRPDGTIDEEALIREKAESEYQRKMAKRLEGKEGKKTPVSQIRKVSKETGLVIPPEKPEPVLKTEAFIKTGEGLTPTQEIARPKTEAEAKIPEGISTEVQQKVAHDLAKEAGILGKEYQKLAAETIGVSSTVQMSEGQAQNFIQKIDELIWKNENKILSSPFVSKDRRMKVLGDRVERVKQIGKSVTSDKFQKDADQLRKNLTALKKDPTKIKDIPDELLDPEKHKEATIFANFHRPGEEFRRDKEAYEFSDKIKEASVGMTETELKWKLEEAEVLKGLDKDDRIAVTMFRENMAGAPTTLTPKQAKYNDFLQKKYDFTHKLFEVPRYIKGYSPRMTSKDVKTAEERLLERFFGEINKAGFLKPGAIKVPGHINEWFKKRRIRKEPKDTELDASVIFHKYIHTGLKAMYFKDIIEEAKTIFPRLSRTSPKMEKLLEDYLFRMLGYPSVNDAAWTATVKDVHKVITTSPGLKQIFKAPGLRKIAAAEIDDEIARYIAKVLIDLGYIRTMGYRPTSFLKQMLQTLNNTVPQLGYSWTVMGLNDLMFGHGIKRASEDKIFHEFAPQLYKELSGAERSNWDKVRDNVMIFHGVGDKINRTIAHGAGIRKFNHYLPAYQKTKDIKKFLHRLEADKLNIRIQEKMEKALENDDTEKAKQIYFKELVDLTQYPYTKEESPMITQSPPGKMVYQLASWPINYADLMKTAVVNKNWKFFARQALMYTMIIGLASKATERKKRFVKRAIGLGPLKREIEFGVIPPSVEPMAKTLWMVGEFMEATINESFEPGSVKAWAKKNEKSLFTLKKYQPLIWKDIQRWLD